MIIKKSIEKIIKKYGLKIRGESYEERIKRAIAEILNGIPKDKKIAIRGAGRHTYELLLLEGNRAVFSCIFDYAVSEKGLCNMAGKKLDIYPNDMVEQVDFDVMVISSFTHRREIFDELSKVQKDFLILDLYDELEKMGLCVNAPFYRNANDSYENVLYYRKEFFKRRNAETLRNLMIAYLDIYDFINFEKYAVEYIHAQYDGYLKIQEALNEIRGLLGNIRERLKERKQRDVIIVWNDQMGVSELPSAPYMEELSRKSLFFENAYTMTPFTVPTVLEMFLGLKSIDDGIYHNTFPVISGENSEIIRAAEAAGYEFVYIGDEADAALFEQQYVMPNYTYNSSCIRCVDLLQRLLDAEKPVCAILHALVETHNPYMSGELENARWYEWPLFGGDTEEAALRQKKESLLYWDKQLAFYREFISDSSIWIFMSDHGARYNYQPIYKEASTHILMFIVGAGVPQKCCEGLFSLYDFYIVVQSVLAEKYWTKGLFKEYVLMQETNIFNRTAIRYYLENDAEENMYAFRAVRTKNELYVKLSSGKKHYYLLPDEETDCIDKVSEERLEWLDHLAGDVFEDARDYEEELKVFRKRFETHE